MEKVLEQNVNMDTPMSTNKPSGLLLTDEDAVNTFMDGDSDSFSPTSGISDEGFLQSIFRNKESLIVERWTITQSIHGRVLAADSIYVYVDCLVDMENKIFEQRKFPVALFEHIDFQAFGVPVVINLKLKVGSSRIDVYSGRGIVDLALFDLNDKWESLRDAGLDNKIVEW